MRCPYCGIDTEKDNCSACGNDLRPFVQTVKASNRLFARGLEKAQRGDLSGAAETLNKSLNLYKYNAQSRNLLGLVYGAGGRLGDALREWVISYNLNPGDNIANEYIEDIKRSYRNLEKRSESIRLYNKALDSLSQQSDDIAIIQLKKAIDVNPDFVEALNLLALCYINAGQTNRAVAAAKRVLEIDVCNEKAMRYMSELLGDASSRYQLKQKQEPDEAAQPAKISPEFVKRPLQTVFRLGVSHFLFLLAGVIAAWFVYTVYIIPPPLEEKDKTIKTLESELIANDRALNDTINARNEEITGLEADKSRLTREVSSLYEEIERQTRIQKLNYAKNLLLGEQYEEAVNYAATIDLIGLPQEFTDIVQEIHDTAFPKLEKSYYDLGVQEYNRANYDDAKDAFTKSIEYTVEESAMVDDSHYYLGRIAEFAGETAAARTHYETIINDYPNSNQLANAKSRLRNLPE